MIVNTAYVSANCRMTVELLLIQHIQCKYICSAYAVYNAASRWPTIQPALFWHNTWALCNRCAEKGQREEMLGGGLLPLARRAFFSAELRCRFFGFYVSSFFSRYVYYVARRTCLPAKGATAHFCRGQMLCGR